MFDFQKLSSPILFRGDEKSAYRDPAIHYENGIFHLFFTYVDASETQPYLTVAYSQSTDLATWSEVRELTPRDRSLNYSSPGNIVYEKGRYILSLQTYPRENGEKYGNARSRVFKMESTDLVHWDAPRLLRVKGDIPEEKMGRMIDPYLVRDIHEPDKWWCLYKQSGVSMSYSHDLEHWTYHGKTASGENVSVLVKDGKYLIFHSPKNGIGILETENFETFREVGELITLGQKDWDWARGRLTAGVVLDLTGDPEFGKYLLFFHGSGPEDEETLFDTHASIGIAWSDDLVHWEWPSK